MMKSVVMVSVVALLLAAGVGLADDVTSINTVGYIKTTLGSLDWGLVGVPFENMDEQDGVTIKDLLPAPPVGTKAYIWRNGDWINEDFGFATTPPPPGNRWKPGTNVLIRGDAIFVNMPAAGGASVVTMGEVPSVANLAGTTTVHLAATDWNMVCFAYPVDQALTNTALNTIAAPGDKLWWWDTEAGGWTKADYGFDAGPPPGNRWKPNTVVLKAGRGYFYFRNGAAVDWVQVKPYADNQ